MSEIEIIRKVQGSCKAIAYGWQLYDKAKLFERKLTVKSIVMKQCLVIWWSDQK